MHWYPNWDSEWMWGMHLVGWIFWVFVAIGVWWAIGRSSGASRPTTPEPPLEVLRRRYAEGALTTEEFEERRKLLIRQGGAAL
jgi:putative membrane protein